MACELLNCCQFFNDHMKGLPKSAAYIVDRLCNGAYEKCSRYRIFQNYGISSVPPYLDPDDTDQVKKIILCLEGKKVVDSSLSKPCPAADNIHVKG